MYNDESFMDVVTIGKKEYKKATLVARDFGYTKDYLGQLCRSEKVDARLVGRTWYVNPDSITEHKKTKQRSNLEKSKKALREVTKHKSGSSPRRPANKNFFDHLPTATKIPSYESDNTDLVPVVKKVAQPVHKLEVGLADAEKLTVESKTKEYIISPSKHPRIRFKGDLSVESVEDESDSQTSEVEETKDEETQLEEVAKEVEIISATEEALQEAEIGVPTKESNSEHQRHADVIHIPIQSREERPRISGRLMFLALSTATVLLLAVAALSIGLESKITATAEGIDEGYGFNIEQLLAQIYIEK